MKIAVWDTYVTKKDGGIMHFDILVPPEIKDAGVVYDYGRKYLAEKKQEGQELDAKECNFCHIGEATTEMKNSIAGKGYHIIEMEGCN